jgi:hypothetical protein
MNGQAAVDLENQQQPFHPVSSLTVKRNSIDNLPISILICADLTIRQLLAISLLRLFPLFYSNRPMKMKTMTKMTRNQ